ncbi:hypothetical protein ZIOFF_053688 [Zingiber officinale]|uniref:Uncharacterized protein n=1 Tax=Zingiber officinale TaxID=94328 RepID=A0A8J5F8B4_ZINOF|nr:hypothetical protein ZIOFF_053688 [Zingiber officinale]
MHLRPCSGFRKTAADVAAAATSLLMLAVALDCLVTAAYLDVGASDLHVIPFSHDAIANNPVLVLGFPCAVLAVACFVRKQGDGTSSSAMRAPGYFRRVTLALLGGSIVLSRNFLRLILAISLVNSDGPANDHKLINYIAFIFLTYNSGAAIYRSIHDPSAVAFVATSYLDLLLLFWCLHKFETAPEENRGWLKAAVWILATLLTVMFSGKVAAIMPWPVALLVYGMAAATAVGGFWAFFLYRKPQPVPLDN